MPINSSLAAIDMCVHVVYYAGQYHSEHIRWDRSRMSRGLTCRAIGSPLASCITAQKNLSSIFVCWCPTRRVCYSTLFAYLQVVPESTSPTLSPVT